MIDSEHNKARAAASPGEGSEDVDVNGDGSPHACGQGQETMTLSRELQSPAARNRVPGSRLIHPRGAGQTENGCKQTILKGKLNKTKAFVLALIQSTRPLTAPSRHVPVCLSFFVCVRCIRVARCGAQKP